MMTTDQAPSSTDASEFPTIEDYISDYGRLERDFNLAIADLQFSENGGKISHAIDFSEIFAYAVPSRSGGFSYHPEDTVTGSAPSAESLALQHLFFGSERRLILLEPYAIELEAFSYKTAIGLYHSVIEAIPNAMRDFESMQAQPGFAKILGTIRDIERSNREPLSDERAAILSFFESNARAIVDLLRFRDYEPLRRLRKLFGEQRFVDSSELTRQEEDFDREIGERWFTKLRRRRGKRYWNECKIDARAVATIANINRVLIGDKSKLLLVTRSRHMHAVMEQEMRSVVWDSAIGNVLRHPRIFAILDLVKASAPDMIKRLGEIKQEVSHALEKARATPKETQRVPVEEYVADLLSRAGEGASTAQSLAVSVHDSSFLGVGDEASRDSDLAIDLVTLFADPTGMLRTLLIDRVQELVKEVEDTNRALSVYFLSKDDQARALLEQEVVGELYTFGEGLDLHADLQRVAYSLQFFSRAARQIVESFSARERFGWQELVNAFLQGADHEWDYERLLAMALILATLGEWRHAEAYCERALSVAAASPNVFPDEGYLFLSVCHRKTNMSKERLIESLAFLDNAQCWRQRRVQNPSHVDPRYLNEKGTVILFLNLFFKGDKDPRIPPADAGLEMLKQAYELPGADVRLKAQIHNNILFYYIESNQPIDKETLQGHYDMLLSLQTQLEPDYQKWPPSFLDTWAWSRWSIFGVKTPAEEREIKGVLKAALARGRFNDQERKQVRAHLDAVEQGSQTPPCEA